MSHRSEILKKTTSAMALLLVILFPFSTNHVKAAANITAQYSIQADLNEDKKKENISFCYNPENSLVTITINEKSLIINDIYLSFDQSDSTIEDYFKEHIHIVDLDKKDKFKEILLEIQTTVYSYIMIKSQKRWGCLKNRSTMEVEKYTRISKAPSPFTISIKKNTF